MPETTRFTHPIRITRPAPESQAANRRLLPAVPIPAAEAPRPAVLQVVMAVAAAPAPAVVAEAVAVAVAPTLAAVVEVAAAEVVRTTNQQRCFVPQSAGATCAEMWCLAGFDQCAFRRGCFCHRESFYK